MELQTIHVSDLPISCENASFVRYWALHGWMVQTLFLLVYTVVMLVDDRFFFMLRAHIQSLATFRMLSPMLALVLFKLKESSESGHGFSFDLSIPPVEHFFSNSRSQVKNFFRFLHIEINCVDPFKRP